MFLPALIAGGGLLGSVLSYFGQSSANQRNDDAAQRQMDFQERMSNTAYQRQVADLRAAGMNPALAYGLGGSTTPSGALGTSANTFTNASSDLSSSAKAAFLETKALKAALEKNRSEIELNQASAARERSAALLNDANVALSIVNAKHATATLAKAQNESSIHDSWIGKNVLAPANVILSTVGNLFGGLHSAKRVFSKSR